MTVVVDLIQIVIKCYCGLHYCKCQMADNYMEQSIIFSLTKILDFAVLYSLPIHY